MNNIRTVFFGMLKRLKYALVIALLVGAGSIGLYYCGRPIANVFSVNDKIDIALTDNDNSELSAMLKSYLSDRINMNIIEDGKEKFNDKLINRDVSAIIEIPQGFEKNVIGGKDVKIKSTTLDDYENGAYISVYIEGFMRSVNIAANAAKGDAELFSKIMNSDAADTKLTKENAVTSDREDEYVSAGFNARTADKFKAGACHAFGLYYIDRRSARRCVVPDRRNGRYAEISVIYHAAILVCRLYVGRGRTACDKHLRAYTLHIAYNACKRRTFRQKVGSFKGVTKGIRIVTYISCIQTHGNSRIRHYEYNE